MRGDAEPVECVLFDLDNTLIPFLGPLRSWARTFAEHAVAKPARGALTDALVSATLDDGEDPQGALAQVADRWGLEHRVEVAASRASVAYRRAIAPYEGIEAAIERLRAQGLELAVVTDAPRERAFERLGITGLGTQFRAIVTREESPQGKKGPEPFQLALSVLDQRPATAAMVGDWPRYDIRWPKRLGIRTILAGWGAQDADDLSPAERPWAIADRPDELVDLLDLSPHRPTREVTGRDGGRRPAPGFWREALEVANERERGRSPAGP